MALTIIGAGGHARVAIATARAAGLGLDDVRDDDPGRQSGAFEGLPLAGPIAATTGPAHVALGDNGRRREIVQSLAEVAWTSLVHPRATVEDSATVGVGALVCAGAVVQAAARLGAHAIVNSGAVVEHDCEIGAFAHVAPGAVLGGGVEVGDGALVGLGARILPRVRIGAWAVVGAGAVVTTDVPAHAVVAGVPARRIGDAR